MPEFFEHLNPMPFEAAAQMEKDLAEDLRSKGYTVTGGTWSRNDSSTLSTAHCTLTVASGLLLDAKIPWQNHRA